MPDLFLVEITACVVGTLALAGLAVLDRFRSRMAVRELFPDEEQDGQ